MFGVSPRTAVRLMNRFGGYHTGRTFLITRGEWIAALERLETAEALEHEVQRRKRVSEDLNGRERT
jgi:hypothetical protein